MRWQSLVLIATALGVVVADQAAKVLVRTQIAPLGSVPLIPGVFYVTHQRNAGAAFGLMQGGRIIFIAVGLIVLGGVVWYWNHNRPTSWPVVISLGLLAGGAIGNLIDRVLVGEVTDFLEFAPVRFPVFNVADVAVVVGTALLVVVLFFGGEQGGGEQGGVETDPGRGESDAGGNEPVEGASGT